MASAFLVCSAREKRFVPSYLLVGDFPKREKLTKLCDIYRKIIKE